MARPVAGHIALERRHLARPAVDFLVLTDIPGERAIGALRIASTARQASFSSPSTSCEWGKVPIILKMPLMPFCITSLLQLGPQKYALLIHKWP